MFRSLRLSWLMPAVLAAGCYSGLDPDSTWTGVTGASAPSSGASAPGTDGDPSDGGDPTDGGGTGGSLSGTATSDGASATDATTDPAGTSGGPGTTGVDQTTSGPDTTNGTTTTGTTDGTTTTGTTNDTTSTTGAPNPDVPDGVPYCDPAKNWDPAWKQKEEDILVLVNQVRAQGANCGAEGDFGPTGPLTMNTALRCAARMHSKDMNDRDFFDHTNPDGELPWDRMDKAGYGNYSNAGENIAGGSADAAGTMDQWMNSDGHCANIMNPAFEEIGVGYYPGGQWGHLWTQVFGAK